MLILGCGGGIGNSGYSTTITNCTIAGNSAVGVGGHNDGFGGGIYNDVTFEGTLTITNSTIAGNSAANQGGGIFSFATMNATNTIVAGNTAPGATPDVVGSFSAN